MKEFYSISIWWEDRITGDYGGPIVVATFAFYHDATEYAKNKLTYYSSFATDVEISITKDSSIVKSLSYKG